jgi:hypothetical protein
MNAESFNSAIDQHMSLTSSSVPYQLRFVYYVFANLICFDFFNAVKAE